MKHTLNSIMENVADKQFVMLVAALGGLKPIFEQYIFSDWQFIIFLSVLVIIDTLTGVYKAWKSKTIESKAWGRVLEKVFLYCCILVTTNVITKFTVGGAITGFFGWFDSTLYCLIVVREVLSIFENVAEIKPDLLPPWVMSRFKKFDETGKFKDLLDD